MNIICGCRGEHYGGLIVLDLLLPSTPKNCGWCVMITKG